MSRYINLRYNRNPNGLYPVCPYPEDYPERRKLQLEGTPLKIDWEECRPPPLPKWHGYTGAIGYFNEPPMPSYTTCVAHNSIPPLPAGIKHYEIKKGVHMQNPPPGVPYRAAQLAALENPEIMTSNQATQLHPEVVRGRDPKQWRTDGRNFHF
jgi:hypothetical protein